PRNVTGRAVWPSAARARATLFPFPPTTSRTARPRTESPGRQGGTVRVLSRHGFNVTQKIMDEAEVQMVRKPSINPRCGFDLGSHSHSAAATGPGPARARPGRSAAG